MKHLFLTIAACCLLGCAQEHSFPDLYPVRGQVKSGGAIVPKGGFVQLRSDSLGDAMLMVQGEVGDDGKFELSTISARLKKRMPGVPEGKYRLVYAPPASTLQNVFPVELRNTFTVEKKIEGENWTVELK